MYIPQKHHPRSDDAIPWITKHGESSGIITLSTLLSVFVLGLIAVLVHNWGWWHLKDIESRRRYIKTWHGWVLKEKHNEKLKHRHERKKGFKNMLRWKTTNADMHWMFWDPDGTKQDLYTKLRHNRLLNLLPRWTRSWQPGATDRYRREDMQQRPDGRISSPHPETLELGHVSTLFIRGSESTQARAIGQVDGAHPDVHTVRSVHYMNGAVPEEPDNHASEGDTVRRRRGESIDSSAWHANSSETSRATVTQFFMPNHSFRTPIWVEDLFGQPQPGDTRLTSSNRQTSATVSIVASGQDHSRFPGAETLRQEQSAARRAVQSSPIPMQSLDASSLGDLRSSTALSGSIEFDSLFGFISKRDSRYGLFGAPNPPRRLVDMKQAGYIPPKKQSQSLTQRRKKLTRPSINSIFPSLRRRLSRGRNIDIVDDARSIAAGLSVHSTTSLQGYENGGSVDGAISQALSMQSTIASRSSNTRRASIDIHDPERMSPVPSEALNSPYSSKKRFSGDGFSEEFSPPTLELHAVSGNTSQIPSLSLPACSTALPVVSPQSSPSSASLDSCRHPNSRLKRVEDSTKYLSPLTPKPSIIRPHRSLDETALRRIDMPEPLRVIRRVGNLQNRSLGRSTSISAVKLPRLFAEKSGAEGKENVKVRKCKWEVKGLDQLLMKPVCGGGRQSVCLEASGKGGSRVRRRRV